MALTRRQKQVLDFLVNFINRHGYSPSFEEVGDGLDLSSLATVHKHIETLEKKGFIHRRSNQSRSVEVVAVPGTVPFAKTALRAFGRGVGASRRIPTSREGSARPGPLEFPLLGLIAAGQPVEAVPNPETFSLGDFASGKGNVFVLRDYILVEGTNTAENGEIVVALTQGTDATLKRFFRESSGRVRLQPANAQMEPIVLPAREVKIQGRVIGVLRKY